MEVFKTTTIGSNVTLHVDMSMSEWVGSMIRFMFI